MFLTQKISLFLTLTNGDVFAATFASFAAGILGVNLSYIDVTDLTLAPGTTITSQNEASIGVRVDFAVTPPDSFSGTVVSSLPVCSVVVDQLGHTCCANSCAMMCSGFGVCQTLCTM